MPLPSYLRLKTPGRLSQELLEKFLHGVSAQQFEETVIDATQAFGGSPSTISQKMVTLPVKKLKVFQEPSLEHFKPFASLPTRSTGAARRISSRWVWT